jgi:hypothetical protein
LSKVAGILGAGCSLPSSRKDQSSRRMTRTERGEEVAEY